VVDPHPKGRHKRFSEAVLNRYESLAIGSPADVLRQTLDVSGAAPLKEVIVRSNLEKDQAEIALGELMDFGEIVFFEQRKGDLSIYSDVLVAGKPFWDRLVNNTIREVEGYHKSFPLRRGMPKEELKSRLKVPSRIFNGNLQSMIQGGDLVDSGTLVIRPGHAIKFSAQQEQSQAVLLGRFAASPYAPPSIKECHAEVGVDVFDAMVELGILHPVSNEVVFRQVDFEQMLDILRQEFRNRGTLTAAEVRDRFKTSRKYVLALLEHLDETGITIREGDVRRLK
jgi:selenocysteine-specific elongation factor